MKKYRVLHHSDGTSDKPEQFDHEYMEGDILQVASYDNKYLCVGKSFVNGNKYFHFKQGKWTYTYDYSTHDGFLATGEYEFLEENK